MPVEVQRLTVAPAAFVAMKVLSQSSFINLGVTQRATRLATTWPGDPASIWINAAAARQT
jgi:hypothetical protein